MKRRSLDRSTATNKSDLGFRTEVNLGLSTILHLSPSVGRGRFSNKAPGDLATLKKVVKVKSMEHGGWIDLHEFSNKYGVSLSTLRRRIRARSIKFKLERGRYWLPDSEEVMSVAPLFSRGHELLNSNSKAPQQNLRAQLPADSLARLNEIENENRRLKAQIAELKTLVDVLEAELAQKDDQKDESTLHRRLPEFNA
jgi:hypothetical protein